MIKLLNTYSYINIRMSTDGKTKLTLSIDGEVLEKAKKVSQIRGIPLSRLVENFLEWFSDPKVYCFRCGKEFRVSKAEVCPKCGWLKCPYCEACRCTLSEEVAESIFYLRKTFEDLLGGRLKL